MRRVFLVALVAIAMLEPQLARADENVTWWCEPTYELPLVFIDTVADTFRKPWKADAWREVRDRALDAWGLPYVVGETPSGALLPFDGLYGEQVASPGVIRLGRDTSGSMQSYGGCMLEDTAGVAVVSFYPLWWKTHNAFWGAVGHEVGHALGLGHPSWGRGIMAGNHRPSTEELEAVGRYYLS